MVDYKKIGLVGTILIISIIATITLYPKDFRQLLRENPTATFILIDYLENNRLEFITRGPTWNIDESYLRWKYDVDKFTIYSNQYVAGEEDWSVYYKRSWLPIEKVSDQSICSKVTATRCYVDNYYEKLIRKRSLIELYYEIGERHDFPAITIVKKTPFYGYSTATGSGGVLVQRATITDHSQFFAFPEDYEVEWIPASGRENAIHKLIWNINKLEFLNNTPKGYVYNLSEIQFGKNIKVTWKDAMQFFDYAYLSEASPGKLQVYFKPIAGGQKLNVRMFDPPSAPITYYANSTETLQTTTSTTEKEALSLTWTPESGSKYLVFGYLEGNLSSTSYRENVRVYNNSQNLFYYSDMPGAANTERLPFFFMTIQAGAGSSIKYNWTFAPSTAGFTAGVIQANLFAIRIDNLPNTQYNYTYAGSATNMDNVWGDDAGDTDEIKITPSTTGLYFIWGSASLSSDTTSSSVAWRLNISDATSWEAIPYLIGGESTWSYGRIEDRSTSEDIAFGVAAIRQFSASEKTIRMQIADIDATASADWQSRSLIVFRLSDVFNYFNKSTTTQTSTTSQTFQNFTIIDIPSSRDGIYVAIGGIVNRIDQTSFDIETQLNYSGISKALNIHLPKDTYDYIPIVFVYNFTQDFNSRYIGTQFRRQDATGTAYVKNSDVLILSLDSLADSVFPNWIVNASHNATTVYTGYTPVLMYSQWNDNQELKHYIFSWNGTGASCGEWANESWTSFQTGNWTNTTKIVPTACSNKVIGFRFFAKDYAGNQNSTDIGTFSANGAYDWPPIPYNPQATPSTPHVTSPVVLSVNWTDPDPQATLSHIWFWTNETGTEGIYSTPLEIGRSIDDMSLISNWYYGGDAGSTSDPADNTTLERIMSTDFGYSRQGLNITYNWNTTSDDWARIQHDLTTWSNPTGWNINKWENITIWAKADIANTHRVKIRLYNDSTNYCDPATYPTLTSTNWQKVEFQISGYTGNCNMSNIVTVGIQFDDATNSFTGIGTILFDELYVRNTSAVKSLNVSFVWLNESIMDARPIGWRMYANDSNGGINYTEIQTFSLQGYTIDESATYQTQSGSLVNDIIPDLDERIIQKETDAYVVPNKYEQELMKHIFWLLYNQTNATQAAKNASAINYTVMKFTDTTTAATRIYYILKENITGIEDNKLGWGTYISYYTTPKSTRSNLTVEVHHPLSDAFVDLIGGKCFFESRADVLFIAGSHRDANKNSQADMSEKLRINSVMAVIQRNISKSKTYPDLWVPHGFAIAEHPGYPNNTLSSGDAKTIGIINTFNTSLTQKGFTSGIWNDQQWGDFAHSRNILCQFFREDSGDCVVHEMTYALRSNETATDLVCDSVNETWLTPPSVSFTELNDPLDKSYDADGNITFHCTGNSEFQLKNISLYFQGPGISWHKNQTNDVTGTSNTTEFNVTQLADGDYSWNCLTYDTQEYYGWADTNWTYSVDTVYPSISAEALSDTTPKITSVVSFNANVTDQNPSYVWFATNETGIWINYSAREAGETIDDMTLINWYYHGDSDYAYGDVTKTILGYVRDGLNISYSYQDNIESDWFRFKLDWAKNLTIYDDWKFVFWVKPNYGNVHKTQMRLYENDSAYCQSFEWDVQYSNWNKIEFKKADFGTGCNFGNITSVAVSFNDILNSYAGGGNIIIDELILQYSLTGNITYNTTFNWKNVSIPANQIIGFKMYTNDSVGKTVVSTEKTLTLQPYVFNQNAQLDISNGLLMDKIEKLKNRMITENSEYYKVPNEKEIEILKYVSDLILEENWSQVAINTSAINYTIIQFNDTAYNRLYYILTENETFDTTKKLQNTVLENLADLALCSGDLCNTGNGAAQVKFNMTSIPASVNIYDAKLCYYITDKGGSPDTDTNISLISDQIWTESSSASYINNQVESYRTTDKTLSSTTLNSWTCVDVLTQVRASYFAKQSNVTIRLADSDRIVSSIVSVMDAIGLIFGNVQGLESLIFEDRENSYATTNYPYLNITYSYPTGWGSFIFTPYTMSNLTIQVPHPQSDINTTNITSNATVFAKSRWSFIPGAHRYANKNHLADITNRWRIDTIFQIIHEEVNSASHDILQIHGFNSSEYSGYPDICLSSGDIYGSDIINAFKSNLETEGFTVEIYDGTVCAELGGTANIQGIHTRSIDGNFIHAEFAQYIRNNLTNRSKVVNAINKTWYKSDTAWFEIALLSPNPSIYTEGSPLQIIQNTTFWMNATVKCKGSLKDCGNVYGGARYNQSDSTMALMVDSETPVTPFWVIDDPFETEGTFASETSYPNEAMSNASIEAGPVDSSVNYKYPLEPGAIGFSNGKRIMIEKQDFMDLYLKWDFQEINSTHWIVNASFDQSFLNDFKSAFSYACSNARWKNLRDKYLSDFDLSRVCNDMKNISSYPLKALTSNIRFSDFKVNLTTGQITFYIIFPDGFKIGEKASLGFGTTIISSEVGTPFTPNAKNICNTNNKKHAVYKYNSTHIFYANTTLSGLDPWTVNQSFYINTGGSGERIYEPSMDCNGNNISIVIPDVNLGDLIVFISIDEGTSWTKYSPVTSYAREEVDIMLKGDRTYLLWDNYTTASQHYVSFMVMNKSDGLAIIEPKNIADRYSTSYSVPLPLSMTVDGTGDINDKVYIISGTVTDNNCYFYNSTDGGTTFPGELQLVGPAAICSSPRIFSNGTTTLYLTYVGYPGGSLYYQYIMNSTNSGITWSSTMAPYSLNQGGSKGSAILNEKKYPTLIIPYANVVAFGKNNGTAWETAFTILSDITDDQPLNAKVYYDQSKIEFIWKRDNKIYYDFIGYDGTPNILGVPDIISYSQGKYYLNCSAIYNGANNGRVEFIWYKNNILQNYNGSTADNVQNLTTVYTNVSVATNKTNYGDWICSARAYNGTTFSGWVNSSIYSYNNLTITFDYTYVLEDVDIRDASGNYCIQVKYNISDISASNIFFYDTQSEWNVYTVVGGGGNSKLNISYVDDAWTESSSISVFNNQKLFASQEKVWNPWSTASNTWNKANATPQFRVSHVENGTLNISLRICHPDYPIGTITSVYDEADVYVGGTAGLNYKSREDASTTRRPRFTVIWTFDDDNPTAEFGTNPANGATLQTSNITFEMRCLDVIEAYKIELWGNWSGGWGIKASNNTMKGYVNATWWNKTLDIPPGNYKWGVKCTDFVNRTDWTDTNRTFTHDINPKYCGLLSHGQTCSIDWLVNATGNINTIWKVDANFTSSSTSENNTLDSFVRIVLTVGGADINATFGPPETSLLKWDVNSTGAGCGPDYTSFWVEPKNQTTTYGIFKLCNNGTQTGNIQARLTGNQNQGWIIMFTQSNSSSTTNTVNMTTTYQTIYSNLAQNTCIFTWGYANCTQVNINPGVSIDFGIT